MNTRLFQFTLCSPIDLHRLCNCHIRMVALLREVEIRNAEKRIAAAAREYKEEKFEFMLVESDGEKLYKIVSDAEINNTISGKAASYYATLG
ncbi:hypothetical protein COOONC_11223 [Cooperia oncophora]